MNAWVSVSPTNVPSRVTQVAESVRVFTLAML